MRSERRLSVYKRILKTVLFLVIFAVLFLLIQRLLMPKWNYPVFQDNVSFSVSSFLLQEKNVDDVIFLGTSHTQNAVSPMMLYEEYGISGFNIGTSAQPVQCAYYLLEQGLKKQKPKVVVFDVSALFFSEEYDTDDQRWHYIMDSMPSVFQKGEIASGYYEMKQKKDGSFVRDLPSWLDPLEKYTSEPVIETFFPLFKYHSRWKELDFTDIRDYVYEDNYFSAGYYLNTYIGNSGITVENMNLNADAIASDTQKYITEYRDGDVFSDFEEDYLYRPYISEQDALWLENMTRLCSDNGAELLLVKYPSIFYPQSYPSCWTKMKSSYMKQFAGRHDLQFLDLLYDVDLGIDINSDYIDGGRHLNYTGTKKVTSYLGKYLIEKYGVQKRTNARFDANREVYDMVCEVAELQMTYELTEYLELLKKRLSKSTVIIAGQHDIVSCLSDTAADSLHSLGLKAGFGYEPAVADSYIAVIDQGSVLYEAASNRPLTYDADINGQVFSVDSSGSKKGAYAAINNNETNYALNSPGINIVVIDRDTGAVIDSVCFNTGVEAPYPCSHGTLIDMLDTYWIKLTHF